MASTSEHTEQSVQAAQSAPAPAPAHQTTLHEPQPFLTVNHLQKSFGNHVVLRDITFRLQEGELVGILGSSGSGKSTFLRCLNLLERPSSGSILWHEKDILDPDFNVSAYRAKVGMVFQQFNLFENLDVLENCMLGQIKVLGVDKKTAKAQAVAQLDNVGLGDFLHAKPKSLSGGQKQRVAIARALAMKPEILLFDEPTSALDPEMVDGVLDTMRKLQKQGLTMMVVTHEIGFAKDACSRVCFMNEGIILEEGSAHDLIDHPKHQRTQEFLARYLHR